MISPRTVALLALVIVVAGAGYWYLNQRREDERQLVFTVPPGSVARLAAGEELDILPSTIQLSLRGRDTLIIRNEDTETIQVGPFTIAPGQRFQQRYYNPGTYDLVCTLHESERLRVIVER